MGERKSGPTPVEATLSRKQARQLDVVIGTFFPEKASRLKRLSPQARLDKVTRELVAIGEDPELIYLMTGVREIK